MTVAHKDMKITAAEFDASMEDLRMALDESGVGAPEKTEVFNLVGTMRRQIVGM